MYARPFFRRLLCLLGWHPRWREFPPSPGDPAGVLARRTCGACGLWQRLEADPSGWSAGVWVRF